MKRSINKSLKEQRLGQIKINNQGYKMIIIAYRKSDDIDVQFEDGSIVYNKTYGAFKNGDIKYLRYEDTFAYYIEVELGKNLNDVWNWEKNNENGINPYKISKCSGKKVWLYCQKHDYHNYDRKGNKIGYETTCGHFYRSYGCSYCGNKVHWKDSLAYNYPQVAKMIAIKENGLTFEHCYNIACKSDKKFYIKCLDCGAISNKKIKLGTIIRNGYSCKICSDGLPIPEKFFANILKQLGIDFEPQLSKSTFDWCKNYRYDFYIPSLNSIFETNGWQHYCKTGGKFMRTLEEEQANDRYKKRLAKANGIKYYSIDCRYSELEWMKNNIIKALGHLLDLSDIDWSLAWEQSQKSKCFEAWYIYNNITHDISEISNMLNLHKSTITLYLKRGVECKKCDYTEKESRRVAGKKNSKKWQRKVICITTKKIFNSISEGAKKYNTYTASISDCCRGEGKSAGKLKDGTPLVWRLLVIDHNRILRGENIKLLRKEVCK